MEKINIAKILKDCPSGMELDCLMYEDVYFDYVDELCTIHCYIQCETHKTTVIFNPDGTPNSHIKSKCVIFPKGKTTWEGFVPPCKFKDGDIVYIKTKGHNHNEYIIIFKEIKNDHIHKNVCFAYQHLSLDKCALCHLVDAEIMRFATEYEKQKLFDAIKENGYRWNAEKKELEKLIEPKFHKGDWVTDGVSKCQICFIDDTQYWYSENCTLGSIEFIDKRYHLWTIQDAKDGDVLAINWYKDGDSWEKIIIFKKYHNEGVEGYGNTFKNGELALHEEVPYFSKTWTKSLHPATKEQCNLLFQKIKETGYIWNTETKTLEKLIEPKFKVGDRIRQIGYPRCYIIKTIEFDRYVLNNNQFIKFRDEHIYEPLPNKFDISTLVPFESRVLVRSINDDIWRPAIYGFTDSDRYFVVGGIYWKQCIPYESNEHLLSTTNDCDDYYKTWE